MPLKESVGTTDLVCFDAGSETNGEETSTNQESKSL
jgi:hypothetical protein